MHVALLSTQNGGFEYWTLCSGMFLNMTDIKNVRGIKSYGYRKFLNDHHLYQPPYNFGYSGQNLRQL